MSTRVESAVTEVESTRVESATGTVESAGAELEQLVIAIIATSAKAKSEIDFFMFLVIFVFNLETIILRIVTEFPNKPSSCLKLISISSFITSYLVWMFFVTCSVFSVFFHVLFEMGVFVDYCAAPRK